MSIEKVPFWFSKPKLRFFSFLYLLHWYISLLLEILQVAVSTLHAKKHREESGE